MSGDNTAMTMDRQTNRSIESQFTTALTSLLCFVFHHITCQQYLEKLAAPHFLLIAEVFVLFSTVFSYFAAESRLQYAYWLCKYILAAYASSAKLKESDMEYRQARLFARNLRFQASWSGIEYHQQQEKAEEGYSRCQREIRGTDWLHWWQFF